MLKHTTQFYQFIPHYTFQLCEPKHEAVNKSHKTSAVCVCVCACLIHILVNVLQLSYWPVLVILLV